MADPVPTSLRMRELLALMAQQYCASASWFAAAGRAKEAARQIEHAVKMLAERENIAGSRLEG